MTWSFRNIPFPFQKVETSRQMSLEEKRGREDMSRFPHLHSPLCDSSQDREGQRWAGQGSRAGWEGPQGRRERRFRDPQSTPCSSSHHSQERDGSP